MLLKSIAAAALAVSASLVAMAGYRSARTAVARQDEYEIQIRHLLRVQQDLASAGTAAEHLGIEKDSEDLGRDIQSALNTEAFVEEHNRRDPQHRWAEVSDIVKQLCGDCKEERAKREAQLREEAAKER